MNTKKTCIVTGASSDLGKFTIDMLSQNGFFVYAIARSKIVYKNKNIKCVVLDITDLSSVNSFLNELKNLEKKIDVLVNIAGKTLSGPSLSFDEADLRQLLEINLTAPYYLIKHAYPLMNENSGKVINTTSLNGIVSMPNFGLYSASKFALSALGNALFYELNQGGVTVTNVIPGAIKKEVATVEFSHKPAREKFFLLKIIFPMLTAQEVASKIYSIAVSKRPPSEVIMGNDAIIVSFLKRFLPLPLWEKLMLFIWQKK